MLNTTKLNPFNAPFNWKKFEHYRNGRLVEQIVRTVDGIIPKKKCKTSSGPIVTSTTSHQPSHWELQDVNPASTSSLKIVRHQRPESSSTLTEHGLTHLKAGVDSVFLMPTQTFEQP